MALADYLKVDPKKFAESFKKNSSNIEYFRTFTEEAGKFALDELKS